MRLKKYLKESTITGGWPDTGGIAGDDDAPTGNILLGRKYTKRTIITPGGSYKVSVPSSDEDWNWDEFEHAKGMNDRDNYHSSLGKQKLFPGRLWKHTNKGMPRGKRRDVTDISKPGESAPEYVKKVTKHTHTRKDMKKNLPPIVFKISKVIGKFTTASGEETVKVQKQIEKGKLTKVSEEKE